MIIPAKKHHRYIFLTLASLGILLSCLLNWVTILGRGYSLFDLGELAGTWGRYDALWYLNIIGIVYLTIPILACLVLASLYFRKTSRILAFVTGLYAMVLTGYILFRALFSDHGLPALFTSIGIYGAFISSCILFFGAIFSKKSHENPIEA